MRYLTKASLKLCSAVALFLILYLFLFGNVTSRAQEDFPRVASYVTDENRDVYVALYQDVAIELKECPSKKRALRLLGLGPNTVIIQKTYDNLVETHSLGAHPAIPCSTDIPFDSEISAQTPLWADLDTTKRYYLESPAGSGRFYSIPLECNAIKTVLGIRQRIAQSSFQGEGRPREEAINQEIVLDCGNRGSPSGLDKPIEPKVATNSHWELIQREVFLSEASEGDYIFVAVYNEPQGESVKQSFLPIYRVDGEFSDDIIWEGSERSELVENKLKELFHVDPDNEITSSESRFISLPPSSPFVEICLEKCNEPGMTFKHAYFKNPGVDLELSPIDTAELIPRANLAGEQEEQWSFNPPSPLRFIGCSELTRAMGLKRNPKASLGWFETLDQAIEASEKEIPVYRCRPPERERCLRKLENGKRLTSSMFKPGQDCFGKTHLRLEIDGTVSMSESLQMDGSHGFQIVEIIGTSASSKSRIVSDTIQGEISYQSSCQFGKVPTLFVAHDLDTLKIKNLDIVLKEDALLSNSLALDIENGMVSLDQVNLGYSESPFGEMKRAIRLCKGTLYSHQSRFQASEAAVHALKSQLSLVGGKGTKASLRSKNYGIVLKSGSMLRMHQFTMKAQKGILLTDSEIKGTYVRITASGDRLGTWGIRLHGNSDVTLKYSSVSAFERGVEFKSDQSKIQFVLPINDLREDNTYLSVGPGELTIME